MKPKPCEDILRNYLLSKNPDFASISTEILKIIKRETESPYGFVGYIDEKTKNLIVPTLSYDVWDICRMKKKTTSFSKFDNLFGWAILNKKPVLVNDVSKDKRAKGVPNGHIKIERFLAAPALIRNETVGILATANKKDPYSDEDLKKLSDISNIYAIIAYHLTRIKKIEEYQNLITQILERSRDIIYVINKKGIIEYVNDRIKDYGYKKNEIIGHITFEFAHPDDIPLLTKALKKAFKTGKTSRALQYRLRKKDGSYFEADQKSAMIFENGKPSKIVGTIRDVTEERRLQKEIQQSNELLNKIFDSAKDAIFVKDFNGNYIKANKACAKVFKLNPQNVVGKNDIELFGKEVADELQKIEQKVREGKVAENTYERIVKGRKFIFNTIKVPLKDEQGKIRFLLGIGRDITKLRKLEREMTLMKARESVTRETDRFAHDVNNILSIIAGYTSLIEEEIIKNRNLLKEIKMIRKSVNRINKVTSHFRKKTKTIVKN
ncbi:MAG: PAS domain S-box protein [Elusimicrobiota bacterium]